MLAVKAKLGKTFEAAEFKRKVRGRVEIFEQFGLTDLNIL